MKPGLEIIEDYIQHGTRRFRIRVKGTKYIINVRAENAEEALNKAWKMAEKLGILKIIQEQSRRER